MGQGSLKDYNDTAFADVFEEPIGEILLENHRVRLIVFDPKTEVIVRWIDQMIFVE
jgi:hypothetical protein